MTTLGLMLGSLPLARTQRHLARLLADVAPANTRVIELMPHDLPHHAPYADVPAPAGALEWRREISSVDGLIVVTPTRDRSIPGSLKSAIDWAGDSSGSSALTGMPTVIAGVSVGDLPRFASLQHLRTVLGDKGAVLRSQPETVLFASNESFDAEGLPVDQDLVAEARELISAAAGVAAHQRRAQTATTGEVVLPGTDPIAAVAAAGPAPASPPTGPLTAPGAPALA